MRNLRFWFAVLIVLALAIGCAHAATSFWLTADPTGTPADGNSITVGSGSPVTLYCFMAGDDPGNTFEVMVGYDTSDAATYGAGKDTNNGATKKLTLASDQGTIVSSIDSAFDVFANAGYANSQVVLDASGRESANADLGGRPYGFVVRAAATHGLQPPVSKLVFSFVLNNNMPQGQSQKVVISNYAGANSYSSAWKNGTALNEDTYTLTVVSGAEVTKPTVGASNKAILDSIMTTAASKYTWTFWGVVSAKDANGFNIDDGSGVTIHVAQTNPTVSNGNYVSVKGSLDLAAKTINNPTVVSHH